MGKAEQQFEHLTDAQIEHYEDRTSGEGPNQNGLDVDQAIETHLADCAGCRTRVLEFHRSRFGLMSDPFRSAAWQSHPPTAECPSEDALRNLAAGLSSSSESATLTQHAAQCPHCGPILRAYTEDFSDDLSPEDQALLSKLKSSSPEWQKKMAQQMAAAVSAAPSSSVSKEDRVAQPPSAVAVSSKHAPKHRYQLPRLKWLLIPATVFASALIAWIAVRPRGDLQTAQKLVASAYAERRTIEMRLPSAPYAPYNPLPVERGANDEQARLQRPSLLDAESAVAKRQQKGILDADWLDLSGRLALIAGGPTGAQRAIDDFEKAGFSGLENPSATIDLAVAYYEQDIKSDHPDLARSLDLLSRVLKNPKLNSQDRSVALFDLAIVYEKTQAWDLAVSTWQQYLQNEPNGHWSTEARQHLDAAKAKIRAQQDLNLENPLSPSTLMRAPPSNVVLDNIEQYQDTSLRHWLVPALSHRESDYSKALFFLASLLAEKHQDLWLRDFLLAPQDEDAALRLQFAIESNSEGLYKNALEQAAIAEKRFAAIGNSPGRLRAEYEKVYAFARSLTSAPCTRLANTISPKLQAASYPWLHSQLLLERAICQNLGGNLSGADADLQESLTIAYSARFPALELRVLGISASLHRQQGRRGEAWAESVQGLQQYWESPPFPDRLYQFYAGMELTAQEEGLTFSAEALGRQAISILGLANDKVQLGAAHLLLADILTGEKQDLQAEEEVKLADYLLASAPNEPTANRYKLIGKIRLARFQLYRHEPHAALVSLEPAREILHSTTAYFVTLAFYVAEGDCHVELNQLADAESSYRAAIKIAEEALRTVHDEGGRLKWIQESDGAYRGLVRLLLMQGKSDEALRWWEWYKDQSLRATSDQTQADSRDVLFAGSYTPAQTRGAHVTYAVMPDGVQIWVTDRSKISSTWVHVPESELRTMTRDFADQCSNPDSQLTTLQRSARKLFELLVQPIGPLLQHSAILVIETDEILNSVPFEALMSPDGWYLGEKYPLVYSPSLLEERRLRSPQTLKKDNRILLVDSDNYTAATYLPGHSSEREAILKLFPHTAVVTPSLARWQDVQHKLAVSEAFHFIGHGVHSERGSGLIFEAGAPPITGSDFRQALLLRERLAVLSACSTGVTNDNGLLDTGSLVHAFLLAGVPQTIASRWNVESTTTARFMKTLYTHLASGEPVIFAIHAARTDMLTTSSHPYYWAGFTVTGRAF